MKYFVAKLSINCHKLYQNIWQNIFLVLETSSQDILHQNFDTVITISSFECYLRSIWIDLMESFHITSPILQLTTSEIHPYIASMSIMNQSIKNSHVEDRNIFINLENLEFQCLCGRCNEERHLELSPQEEGETLRQYFQQITLSKENNIIVPNIIPKIDIETKEIVSL